MTDDAMNEPPTVDEHERWDDPLPLDGRPAVPTFPTHALPGTIAKFVEALAVELQVPEDMPGVTALGPLSLACARKVKVRPAGRKWVEPTNLFTVVGADPSSGKSIVYKRIVAPVREAEQHLVESTKEDRTRLAQQREIADKVAKEAQSSAITTATGALGGSAASQVDAQAAEQRAIDARLAADEIEVPFPPQLLAQDVPPEALVTIMSQQNGRIAVMSDEGGPLQTLTGTRYSKNGTSNLEALLQSWNGSDIRVDRQTRDSVFVAEPALTLCLAMQPVALRELFDQNAARGRGVLSRFLFTFPESFVGWREVRPPDVPDDVEDAYVELIRTLILSLDEVVEPITLQLDDDATDLFYAWKGELEPRLRPTADIGSDVDLKQWAGKLAGTILRLAAVLHVAEYIRDGWQRPISPATLVRALGLGDYFVEHARITFETMVESEHVDDARRIVAAIRAAKLERFVPSAVKGLKGCSRYKTADDRDPILRYLVGRNVLRLVPGDDRPGPGRKPDAIYEVNPAVLADDYEERNRS